MKITIDRNVLEQALDALEKALPITREQLYAIISLREALAQPAAPPKKRETWLAIREGHLNAASDSYFTARPQLDSAVNRRIFCAGHFSGYGDEAPQPAAQPTNCRHCGGPETVLCGGQCKPAAQPTIDLSRLDPFVGGLGKAILQELKEDLAAQPAAQPTEPAGEPVAWYEHNPDLDAWFLAYSRNPKATTRPLVFGDTARPAVPLTDEQIHEIGRNKCHLDYEDGSDVEMFARAIEAAHKIGNQP
jgi:hypothetical protein